MNNKYNQKRKQILLEIDNGKKFNIEELAMYDLTPYFQDTDEPNLYETIILNKNEQRKVEHIADNIYFSPPQYEALNFLENNDKVIFSAPTSFGKTMIVKEYIFRKKPNNIIYIVPTNALAYELEISFKENDNFSDYLIYDKLLSGSTIENKKMFFIGTQEKFLELDQSLLGEIDLFVIDEAYKLQESIDNIRSYKLSETFLNCFVLKSRKIFLLSPVAEFIGFEKYNFSYFNTKFNAVEKNYVLVNEKDFFDKLLKEGNKNKTILFCSTPAQINETYYKIESSNLKKIKSSFLTQLKQDIHPEWIVAKLLEQGILVHHGQMPKYIQNRMINLFNHDKKYNILLGTTSISEGINTVTKNLFIHPENTVGDKLLLKNTIGRAGRLGKYPIGYIFSTKELESQIEDIIQIKLAISEEKELKEIEESKQEDKIKLFCMSYNISEEVCKLLLKKYKLSLIKLGNILNVLMEDLMYPGIESLPFMSKQAIGRNYNTDPNKDKHLIKGYLNSYFINANRTNTYLNTFSDRIAYYKYKVNDNTSISEIINLFMQFIYATLEYNIMPIVNIGLDINDSNSDWAFGANVIETLEECRQKYYRKSYGSLDVDNLSESHKSIISAMKDYGMTNSIKKLSIDILNEIEERLNVRYSTSDIIRAIEYLSINSKDNKLYFTELKNKYIY